VTEGMAYLPDDALVERSENEIAQFHGKVLLGDAFDLFDRLPDASVDSPSFSHHALDVSPAAAIAHIEAAGGFLEGMARRLRLHWPELARTLDPNRNLNLPPNPN
jgi:hypothetical protein